MNDRFLTFRFGLGFLPTSSMMAFAAALLKTGEAMALCSELLGPLPPAAVPLAKTPFFRGENCGLMLDSLEDPNNLS